MVADGTRRWRRHQRHQSASAQAGVFVRQAPETEEEILARIDRYAWDPEAFIQECLWVRHIDGGRIVPFTLTVGQKILVRKLRWHLLLGEAVRLLVLKSRRQKISSLCQALAYWYASTRAYVNALTCADKKELTEKIAEQGVKFYYEKDERRSWGIRPEIETSNRTEFKFGNPDKKTREEHPGLQSSIFVTSAESKDPGRGETLHFVHGSEAAYWPETDPTPWQGIGIALSNAPGTVAIIESTGNGAGGFFFSTAKAAIKGRNEFVFVFLPWWIDPANTEEVTEQEKAEWKWVLTEEEDEEKVARRYKLSFEQLKWRRSMIASSKCYQPGKTRYEVFRQEYPSSEQEAWLASARNYFIPQKIDEWENHPEKGARPPLYRARVVNEAEEGLDLRGPGRLLPVLPKLERDVDGELAVWAERDPLDEYLVICDPAEGIQGRDETAIGVLARNAFDFVSIFRTTSLSTREAAHVAALLGWYYGTAMVVVEANNHGSAVLQELQRIVYPKLWYHRNVLNPGEEITGKPGWFQNYTMRMYALGLLESESRTPLLGIHDEDFFDQARTFVWPKPPKGEKLPENPKPAAMAGHHDDLILMVSIALGVHVNAAIARRKAPPPPKGDPNEPLRPEPMDLSMKHIVQRREQRRVRGRSLWGRGTRR